MSSVAKEKLVSKCERCGGTIMPVRFTEYETDKYNAKTGRFRKAVSHLECEDCGKKITIDDSFDTEWQCA